ARPRRGEEDHFLVVGRLSEEKGIATLLDAWRIVGQDCRLKVVGTGPLAPVNGAYLKEPHIAFFGGGGPDGAVAKCGISVAGLRRNAQNDHRGVCDWNSSHCVAARRDGGNRA